MLKDIDSPIVADVEELLQKMQESQANAQDSMQAQFQEAQMQLSLQKAQAEIQETQAKAMKYEAQSKMAQSVVNGNSNAQVRKQGIDLR